MRALRAFPRLPRTGNIGPGQGGVTYKSVKECRAL